MTDDYTKWCREDLEALARELEEVKKAYDDAIVHISELQALNSTLKKEVSELVEDKAFFLRTCVPLTKLVKAQGGQARAEEELKTFAGDLTDLATKNTKLKEELNRFYSFRFFIGEAYQKSGLDPI